jgi:hypothetical protein
LSTSIPNTAADPPVRGQQGGQDTKGRALARAVGAEQTEDLSLANLEGDRIDRDRDHVPEGLNKVVAAHREWCGGHASTSLSRLSRAPTDRSNWFR